MIDGFRYLRGHPVLLMSFVVDIIAMVFGMPRALFPEMAHTSFGGPEGGGLAFALLFAAIPAGAVLGGIFSGWVSRVERQGLRGDLGDHRLGRWRSRSSASRPVSPSGTAGVMLGVAVGMLVIGGAADMVSSAFRNSMLMTAATDEVRGRLQGIFIVVVAGGPRIADVAHGSAAALVGTSAAAAGGGVLVVIGTVVAALAVPAFVRYRLPAVTSRCSAILSRGRVSPGGVRRRDRRAEPGVVAHQRDVGGQALAAGDLDDPSEEVRRGVLAVDAARVHVGQRLVDDHADPVGRDLVGLRDRVRDHETAARGRGPTCAASPRPPRRRRRRASATACPLDRE